MAGDTGERRAWDTNHIYPVRVLPFLVFRFSVAWHERLSGLLTAVEEQCLYPPFFLVRPLAEAPRGVADTLDTGRFLSDSHFSTNTDSH